MNDYKSCQILSLSCIHVVYSRLIISISQSNIEPFQRQKMKCGCTNIHILDILLFVTKLGVCYSAPYGLDKLINVKSLFSVSNVDRNRKQQHQKVRKYTIPAKQRKYEHPFPTINFGNVFIADFRDIY